MKNSTANILGKYAASFGATALVLGLSATAFGQTTMPPPTAPIVPIVAAPMPAPKPTDAPLVKDYRGVTIGMTADQVREKLDKKPKLEDQNGFYYVFSDDESAQIQLDKDKKVRVISASYSGRDSAAPTFADVFGADAPLTENEKGGVYKLVRYPQSGFWVAYSRVSKDNPMVTVTMQKMRKMK